MVLQGKALIVAIIISIGNGFLLLGYDQGVMGGLVGFEGNYFAKDFGNPDPTLTGLIVSIYEIGCMFGAIFVLCFGEKIGRRNAILYGGGVVVIGTIIQCSSTTVAQLIVGRIVAGLGNGVNTSTLAVYQSETSDHETRGVKVTMEGITAIFGALIAYWIDFGFSYVQSTAQWRFPVAFQAFFAILMSSIMFCLPETPRFLVKKGRTEEAKSVIARLAGKDVPLDDIRVTELFDNISAAIQFEESQSGAFSYHELFTGGKIQNFRRICLCAGIQFMEEMGGANLVTYYLPVVLQTSMNLSRFLALLLSGINAITYFIAATIPIFLIERVGRRPLLIYGSTLMMLCMTALAITTWHGGYAAGVAGTFFIFLYEVAYASGGWMATPFLYPAEICTLRIRSKGSAAAVITKWAFNFLVVMVTPVAVANIGYRTYVIFAVLNASFVVIVFCFYPETKGITLEATDTIFEGGDPIFGGVLKNRNQRKSGRTQAPQFPQSEKPSVGNEKTDTQWAERKESGTV